MQNQSTGTKAVVHKMMVKLTKGACGQFCNILRAAFKLAFATFFSFENLHHLRNKIKNVNKGEFSPLNSSKQNVFALKPTSSPSSSSFLPQMHFRTLSLWVVKFFYHSTPSRKRPGVNFINVFMGSFYACRSQKRKKLLELTVFLHLGSVSIKAAHKMMVKFTPGVNLTKLFFVVNAKYFRFLLLS